MKCNRIHFNSISFRICWSVGRVLISLFCLLSYECKSYFPVKTRTISQIVAKQPLQHAIFVRIWRAFRSEYWPKFIEMGYSEIFSQMNGLWNCSSNKLTNISRFDNSVGISHGSSIHWIWPQQQIIRFSRKFIDLLAKN